ncbi:hypothetical protein RBU55_21580 [Pseudomonas chlororaphis subsp. aurantiaca]|uniref:hypothetical protein n=1 Tax=Pseudomonas chlororaphis TaxID=587753 RepID=UPI0027DB64BD|nr:hypothetical protein [Pseudomonas chlororaphis]WMI98142.1 hypothetical protein RBU55_21580 [Pseudomonas chlororaphis subsp. aurantiaca]
MTELAVRGNRAVGNLNTDVIATDPDSRPAIAGDVNRRAIKNQISDHSDWSGVNKSLVG